MWRAREEVEEERVNTWSRLHFMRANLLSL